MDDEKFVNFTVGQIVEFQSSTGLQRGQIIEIRRRFPIFLLVEFMVQRQRRMICARKVICPGDYVRVLSPDATVPVFDSSLPGRVEKSETTSTIKNGFDANVEQPVGKKGDKQADKGVDDKVDDKVDNKIDDGQAASIGQLVNQSTGQLVNQSTGQLVNQSTGSLVSQSTGSLASQLSSQGDNHDSMQDFSYSGQGTRIHKKAFYGLVIGLIIVEFVLFHSLGTK